MRRQFIVVIVAFFLAVIANSQPYSLRPISAARQNAPASSFSCLQNLVGPSVFNGSSQNVILTFTRLLSPSECEFVLDQIEPGRDSPLGWDSEVI